MDNRWRLVRKLYISTMKYFGDFMGFLGANPSASAGDIRDVGSFPGSGRSPGGGHGHPF